MWLLLVTGAEGVLPARSRIVPAGVAVIGRSSRHRIVAAAIGVGRMAQRLAGDVDPQRPRGTDRILHG
jgi:hypothetical protein